MKKVLKNLLLILMIVTLFFCSVLAIGCNDNPEPGPSPETPVEPDPEKPDDPEPSLPDEPSVDGSSDNKDVEGPWIDA